MTTITLPSTNGKYSRKAWYSPAATQPGKVAIFLDAEYYLDHLEAPELIAELTENGEIPPLACLFVSNKNAEARHHDYTCSDPFSDYIARDVLPWTAKRAGIASTKGHLVAGLSLSGLQSAYLSLAYPDAFSFVLSQSGSFWWENEWLAKHLREFIPSEGKFWLSAGTKEKGAGMVHAPTDLHQDIDQDIAIHHFAEALRQHGHQVRQETFEGGHESSRWKEELPTALRWLLSGKNS